MEDRDRELELTKFPVIVKTYTADHARIAMETVVSRSVRTLLSLKNQEARIKEGIKVYVNNLPVYLMQLADVLANQAREIRDIKDKLEKGVKTQDSEE